jgi:1-acyl-sn-glycerol-3-phosphate acyltransferase
MRVMRFTCAMDLRIDGIEQLRPAPVVVLARHASLADSLVSAYVICDQARLYPRYVLKRELRSDPVLDIVGSRIPNHFLDRSAPDAAAELDALRALSSGLADNNVAVIFPEGTRANPAKRTRALTKIAERDPARAARLSRLTQLLPPRPAGTRALLDGAPGVDVVVAWHRGFEGFDTFGGILRGLSRPVRIHFVMRRIPRAEVPDGERFERWLDETWSTMDLAVQSDLDAEAKAAR